MQLHIYIYIMYIELFAIFMNRLKTFEFYLIVFFLFNIQLTKSIKD